MSAAYAGQFITPGRFAGKVAVVTGAAQGIGQKVAERIGAEGGAVVLVDRAELVHEVAQGIQDAAQGSGSAARPHRSPRTWRLSPERSRP